MTVGALIFARNNERTDYIAMARWSAKNIERHLGIPTHIVTDDSAPGSNSRYFSDVGTVTWHNLNRMDAYRLSPWDRTLVLDADYVVDVEISFFDVEQTKQGVSVFHEDKNEVVIRMKGILYKNGKKVKQEFSEGKSTEISTSTIIIDEGGKFNQESASSAIKKTTINLITKLL